jgi:hypothetical protein
VDCVIEEAELRQVLVDAHYYPDEINQVVKNDLAARRIRTFLPPSDMVKAVKKGLIDVNDAANQLQCRGYTYDDMVVELLLKLGRQVTTVRRREARRQGADCSSCRRWAPTSGSTGRLLRPNVLKYLQCLNAEFLPVPPYRSASKARCRRFRSRAISP